MVIDGQVKWVLDAYTTTTQFPYAQRTNPRAATLGSDLRETINYVRNSVKATVDAHDGTVTFYIVDEDDPIVQSYKKQFPDLFADGPPPMELQEHFRYPEDLFRVQTDAWGPVPPERSVGVLRRRGCVGGGAGPRAIRSARQRSRRCVTRRPGR